VSLDQKLRLHYYRLTAMLVCICVLNTQQNLATAAGKSCYVVNCSPELDHVSLGTLITGAAASGAWLCLDELDRLSQATLTVCSLQLAALCTALKACVQTAPGLQLADVTIDGETVTLSPACAVLATLQLQPSTLISSAHASVLPEGLKAQFRPVSVLAPDMALIVEHTLLSEGFVLAAQLARKLCSLFSALQDTLADAAYDWGLRALKVLIALAARCRRDTPHLTESYLIARTVRELYGPRLQLPQHTAAFETLLRDFFPTESITTAATATAATNGTTNGTSNGTATSSSSNVDAPSVEEAAAELRTAVKDACEEGGLWPDAALLARAVQLNGMLAVHSCVILTGAAACGKTTLWQALREARSRGPRRVAAVTILAPNTVTTAELYGSMCSESREWRDGLLSACLREQAALSTASSSSSTRTSTSSSNGEHSTAALQQQQQQQQVQYWTVLDGEVHSEWAESLNTALDASSQLTLANGERIAISPCMRVLMETSDLSCAAPATVSRAGVLHISDQQQHSSNSSSSSGSIGDVNAQWRCLIAAWVQRQDAPEAHKLAQAQLFEVYIPQLVQRLNSNSSSSSGAATVPLQATTAVITLLQLLETFSQAPGHAELVREQLILEHAVVFCAVWAFGASLLSGTDGSSSSDPRKSFSDWWRSTFTRGAELPLSGSVFDYYLALDSDTLQGDPLRCRFELWTADLLQPVVYSSSSVHSAVMLQTGESTAVAYWARQRLLRGESVLVAGPAGTGKTQLITALVREARVSALHFLL
jgi:dynein heavy chain, axonemal